MLSEGLQITLEPFNLFFHRRLALPVVRHIFLALYIIYLPLSDCKLRRDDLLKHIAKIQRRVVGVQA